MIFLSNQRWDLWAALVLALLLLVVGLDQAFAQNRFQRLGIECGGARGMPTCHAAERLWPALRIGSLGSLPVYSLVPLLPVCLASLRDRVNDRVPYAHRGKGCARLRLSV